MTIGHATTGDGPCRIGVAGHQPHPITASKSMAADHALLAHIQQVGGQVVQLRDNRASVLLATLFREWKYLGCLAQRRFVRQQKPVRCPDPVGVDQGCADPTASGSCPGRQ